MYFAEPSTCLFSLIPVKSVSKQGHLQPRCHSKARPTCGYKIEQNISKILWIQASLVDFLNEHWFITAATSTESFFIGTHVTSCSAAASATQTIKAHTGYNAELHKGPCHKADSKIFQTPTKLAKFNVDFESCWPLEKHPCVTRISSPFAGLKGHEHVANAVTVGIKLAFVFVSRAFCAV